MTDHNREIKSVINENYGKGQIRVNCFNCEGSQQDTLSINTETGVYHCFRCGIKGNALKNGFSDFSEKSSAQDKAIAMLNNSYPVNGFPYLRNKQIKAYNGIREYQFQNGERCLLIPVMNHHDEVVSLQIIKENGDKLFLKDTEKKGNFFRINGNKMIFICEGYATGASIHEATGGTVYVAFDAGNIPYVLKKIHDKYDEIVICADNDHKREDNPGINKAISAALEYENVKVVCPVDIEGTDFNDMMIEKGAEAVKERIAQAWIPTEEELPNQPERKAEPKPQVFNLTDFGNAERLIHRHGDNIKFSFEAGKWLVWNGKNWEVAEKGEIEQFSKETIRSIVNSDDFKQIKKEYQELKNKKKNNEKFKALSESERNKIIDRIDVLEPIVKNIDELFRHAKNSEQQARVNAMIKLAKTEPGVTIDLDELDSNKWLFNCENGTIDLKTGQLKSHDRLDLNSKISPVQYDPAAECPLWDKFLDDVFSGDKDLIHFVQKAIGYSLTGMTNEQCFFLLHGDGSNGKGVFLQTLMSIFSDYSKVTDFTTFTIRTNDSIRNDLAALKGSRLVSASESEKGQVLAESVVKSLTGCDPVTARFLHQEFFTFTPEFKIFLACNYEPRIKGTDYGIWRRVMYIPFNRVFKKHEQDMALAEKLKAELPGILAWAVSGCLKWQSEGLTPPDAVLRATQKYKEDQDILSDFLNECCKTDTQYEVSLKEIYETYKTYMLQDSIKPLGKKVFSIELEKRGFVKSSGKGNKTKFMGIGIRDDDPNGRVKNDEKVKNGVKNDDFENTSKTTDKTDRYDNGVKNGLKTDLKINPKKDNKISTSQRKVKKVKNDLGFMNKENQKIEKEVILKNEKTENKINLFNPCDITYEDNSEKDGLKNESIFNPFLTHSEKSDNPSGYNESEKKIFNPELNHFNESQNSESESSFSCVHCLAFGTQDGVNRCFKRVIFEHKSGGSVPITDISKICSDFQPNTDPVN